RSRLQFAFHVLSNLCDLPNHALPPAGSFHKHFVEAIPAAQVLAVAFDDSLDLALQNNINNSRDQSRGAVDANLHVSRRILLVVTPSRSEVLDKLRSSQGASVCLYESELGREHFEMRDPVVVLICGELELERRHKCIVSRRGFARGAPLRETRRGNYNHQNHL